MSALSQGFRFSVYNSTSSVTVVYPNSATNTMIYKSYQEKGDGYYGSSGGLHTVMYTADQNFVGTMTVQASLASSPIESDWFEVSDAAVTYTEQNHRNTSTMDYLNFTGNFVWVRGQVSIARGSVESILYNH